MTLGNVKSLLGETDLSVAKLVNPGADNTTVTFNRLNDNTYAVDLCPLYSYALQSIIGTDGTITDLHVYLTPYTEFLESMGREDDSILNLNRKGVDDEGNAFPVWFQYANDVDLNNLYGLFSVITFEERVSNIQDWFAKLTYDGTIVQYSMRETRGSSFYKAFDMVASELSFGISSNYLRNTLGFSNGTTVGKAFCEIVNSDNKTYQTYYTYLDGSTVNSMVSNGGADHAGDDDNAIQNTVQDVKDGVDSFFDGLKDVFSFDFGFGDFDADKLGFILGTVGILAVVGILIFAFTRNNKPPKRRK